MFLKLVLNSGKNVPNDCKLQSDELRRGSSLSSWCHLYVSILVTLVDVRQNGCICHCCEGNNDVFESLFPLRDIEHWCRQTCSLSSSFGTVSQDAVYNQDIRILGWRCFRREETKPSKPFHLQGNT